MKDMMTIEEAYKAMYLYLDHLYKMTGSDDLGSFLGSMSLLPESGEPADSAVWDDWLESIKKAKAGANINLKILDRDA